jgi:hypothetical protein
VQALIAASLICLALSGPPAFALDIVAELNASQQQKLSLCKVTSDEAPAAKILQRSFKLLQDARATMAGPAATSSVRLLVADCEHGIQVLAGEVVVPAEVASWDEGARLFVLAHELGHIEHRDWDQLTAAYAKGMPQDIAEEDVPQALTSVRAHTSPLKRNFEYAADKYALRLLTRLGRNGLDDADAALQRIWSRDDTPTHPGAMQRLAALMFVQ